MFNLFHGSGYYYYADIALQIFCVIHCIRNNKQTWWIWLIIFVPFIGGIAYLYTEVFSRRNNHLVRKKVHIGAVINPGGHTKNWKPTCSLPIPLPTG